ncbi:MAG: FAD-dependent oxidoreductase [Rhodocyclales bacterium]|nr:FAD-dependent oxidoreductase [Rhodocyclales bacterium]
MPTLALEPAHSFPRAPHAVAAGEQDTLPSRYGWPVHLLALAGFTLAFVGWLNETWLYLFDSPIWLNRYTEYAIILAFGLWRIASEKNAYTRRRLVILVGVVTGLWWLLPWLYPFVEPHVGYLWSQPVFPSLHTPGTLTFFLVLGLVFLFGRRVICGFGCPCVGIRETVGFPFRKQTPRGELAWKLRHLKWLFFAYYVGIMVATQFPPNSWTLSLVGGFYGLVATTYFGTFFLAPLVGNRAYCRFLCPFGATFGLINHAGCYDLKMDSKRCIDCGRCEQACDMGIPVWQQGKEHGRVTGLEDCMGCARCVVSCPTDALEIRDVRNFLRPALRQDATHLLRRVAAPELPRIDSCAGRLSLTEIQTQASRCLDCGEPTCRAACPLHNHIPEWLMAAARGRIEDAANIMAGTSPMAELCGALCPQDRLCEGSCARLRQGEAAVAIGAIEHAVTEEALARGWRPPLTPKLRLDKTAAVIGAGPAGLAFAEAMNRAGWQVTVYDREASVGGMLATGLPPFRFDKRILDRRRILMEQAGIDFELGAEIDEAAFLRLRDEYDAVFLGIGARQPRVIGLHGKDLYGVDDALSFLARINRGEAGATGGSLAGKRVLVLGGGDTAMDCARAALRDGATSVAIAYRGTAEKLRANPHERRAASEEGVSFLFQHVPLAIEGEAAARGVRCRVGAGDTASEVCLPAEAVILAFGQQPAAPRWLDAAGVATEYGAIKVDAHGRTSHPRIFAGGDAAHGPDLIVTAAAAGRRAARCVLAQQRLAGWKTWQAWRAAPPPLMAPGLAT